MEIEVGTGCPGGGEQQMGSRKGVFQKKEIELIDYLGEQLCWVGVYSPFGEFRIKFMSTIHKTKQTKIKLEEKQGEQRPDVISARFSCEQYLRSQ